ncbi:MAG: sulfatase-like hydrolase/transferase [Verrucomicrobiota bacterium]
MKIISIKVSILAALLFSGHLLPSDLIAQEEGGIDRPDMVIFLSDDHTWRDSSVYGSPDIETPNMARLAKAGMTFHKAYVASPSCAPSRAALLTGLYPANNGAEPNHSRPRADIKKLPAYLQELGYEVASFGKVGHYRQTAEYGFDVARHFNYHEDTAIPKALEWLKARDSKKPLCLFVGTNWPHVPWPEDIGKIDPAKLKIPPNHVRNPTTRKWRARYTAAIHKMDHELGEVYDLAREKLGNDTFFLHTSDHGAQWPFGKWNLYDDGIRTPMIVSWPGHIKSGARSDAMVSWIDILPTLVDVAGGKKPKHTDGYSFLPVLLEQTKTHRDVIFTTHSGDGNNNVYPIRAAMTPDGWKYIRNLHPEFRFTSHVTKNHGDNGYWQSWVNKAKTAPEAKRKVKRYQQRPAEELYFVTDDPYEQNNLVGDPAQAERLAGLRKKVETWMKQTNDPQEVFGTAKRIAQSGKVNIIIVFIDDMGWSDLSCFGGKRVETQNIDRLAAEGIKFTNFYVNSPICSPSRTALTTGQYPQRWKIGSYLARRKLNRERGMAQWLDPKAPVLARELRRAGYATGHFGKWHMGGQRDVGNAPLIAEYGFDRSLTNFEGLGPRILPLKDAYDGKPPKKHDLGSADLGKGPIIWKDRSVITAEFVKEAVKFIDHAQVTEQPFFLNLWPDDVHGPWFPPEVLRDTTDGSKRELYYAVLKAMDQQLAFLFDRVRNDEKLKNNTLILIASDNGHEDGAGSSDPLRGSKTWLYEGGVRSPLIVWGPGIIESAASGTTNDESIFCALDLNRSLYALTGTELPQGETLDGENLIDTLLGKIKTSRKAPIFWRRPPDRPGSKEEDNPDLAVREGKWKFLINYDGRDPQLYDLDADISESNNLAAKNPEIVERLKKSVWEWNAELPVDAGDPAFQKERK